MDTALLGAGMVGLLIGVMVGRWSARSTRRRLVWAEPARSWPPDEEIERLVRAGRKIHAIKRHRELHGSDLRQAKDAIDAVEAPLLRGS